MGGKYDVLPPRPEELSGTRPTAALKRELAYKAYGERLAVRLRGAFGGALEKPNLSPKEAEEFRFKLSKTREYNEIFEDVYEELKRKAPKITRTEAVAKLTVYCDRALIRFRLVADGFEKKWMSGVREVLRARRDELAKEADGMMRRGRIPPPTLKEKIAAYDELLKTRTELMKEFREMGKKAEEFSKGGKAVPSALKQKINRYRGLLKKSLPLDELVRDSIEKSGSLREFFERVLARTGESGHVGFLNPESMRQMKLGEGFNALDHGINKLTSGNPLFRLHTGEAVLRMKLFPEEIMVGRRAEAIRNRCASEAVREVIAHRGGVRNVEILSEALRAGGAAEALAAARSKKVPMARPVPARPTLFKVDVLAAVRREAWRARKGGAGTGMIALAFISTSYIMDMVGGGEDAAAGQVVPRKVK